MSTPADRAGAWPHARVWPMARCSAAALLVLWLPLALLQEVDALRVFSPLRTLVTDASVLVLLTTAIALAWAAVASLVRAVLVRVHPVSKADAAAWAVLLIPLVWICGWQLTRSVRMWLQAETGWALGIGAHTRLIGIAVLALVALLAWWRIGAHRAGRRLIALLDALGTPALAVLVLAAIGVAWAPPTLRLRADPRPVPLAAPGSRPDVLLISIDALSELEARPCDPAAQPRVMPSLHAFAQQATCFTHLYAGSNFTTPTTSTIETGTLPWSHFATQIGAKVLPPLRDGGLADSLRRAGYETHFITDNFLASPLHHGTWRGYDDVRFAHTDLLRNRLRAALTVFPDTDVPLLFDTITSFIGALDIYLQGDRNPYHSDAVYDEVPAMLRQAKGPAFIWAHTMPPHAPYLPLPGFKYRLLPKGQLDHWDEMLEENVPYTPRAQRLVDEHRLRYLESMMGADAALGRLLQQLQREGRLDHMVVIVTADHGESFSHGYIGHAGPLLNESLVRIPLVVKLPKQSAGRVLDTPVSQADLLPTILDAASAPPLRPPVGISLLPAARGQLTMPDDRPVYFMEMERQSRFVPLRAGRCAVVEGRYKLVTRLREQHGELYDTLADPSETRDVSPEHPDVVQRLNALLQAQLAQAEQQRRARIGTPVHH